MSARSGRWLFAAAIFFLGCGSGEDDPTTPDTSAGGSPASTSTTAGTTASSAGSPAPAAIAGTSGSAGAPPALDGRASTGTTALPCDVADVLKRRCQSCHAATPVAGVPMALVSWEDLRAPAVTQPERAVYELAAMRVHDAQRPMPPTVALPAAELATLDAWLAGGASAGDAPSCAPPGTLDGGVMQPKGPPDGSTCYTLRAHGMPVAGDTSPWVVSSQHYACFYFDMPWPAGAQGVYFAPEYDDHPNLVHHWIVYLDQDGAQPDGFVEECTGLHPSSPTMVAGWAPGSDNNDLPPDVGMDISPANHKILLEMHFFHDGVSAPIETTSGVKVCTSGTPLTNTATISLLGTEAIAIAPRTRGTASGTCTPQSMQDIHILRSWPHMHEHGRALETLIMRANGMTETLGSWPFDFNSQVSYPTPTVIHPGDSLTTTCSYENDTDLPVAVGTDTQSEMCFNFVTAYPAKALLSLNALGTSTSATGSATACLE